MAGAFLINYDVESNDPSVTSAFLRQVVPVQERANARATLFVVGRTALLHADELRALATHPLFDFQQHSFSHPALMDLRLDDGRLVKGSPFAEVQADLRHAQEALERSCGVRCTGLSTPYCCRHGLSDRPDLLACCWELGLRFIFSDGRDEQGRQPLTLDRQPYWYAAQGFPQLLECCVHGWVDCNLRPLLGWERLDEYVAAVRPWLAQAATREKVYMYAQHDWSSLRADSEMRATAAILDEARKLGLRSLTCADYYAERLAALHGAPVREVVA